MSRQIENMRKLHAGELDEIEEFGITFVRESRAVAAEQRVAELERGADEHRRGAAYLEDQLEKAEAERDALKERLLELLDALYRSDIDWEGCLHEYRNARKAALAASVSKEEARDA